MTRPRHARPSTLWALFLLAICPIAAAAERTPAIPAKGLVVYVEYDGLAAHADVVKATAAYAMFERTPAGAMTADIVRQVVDHLLKTLPGQKRNAADLLALQEHVVQHGFCLGIHEETTRGASCVVVLNGLGRKDVREPVVARLVSKKDGKGAEASRFRGRELYRVESLPTATPKAPAVDVALWFEGDDLIVVVGPTAPEADGAKDDLPAALPLRVASVIDTIEGEASSVLIHPGRAAALAEGKDIKGFESDGLFFVELGKKQAFYARLWQTLDSMTKPYEGLTLPQGKTMHDDVQHFAPAPASPVANWPQADAQRARMRALGIDPVDEAFPPAQFPPKVASTVPSPAEIPGPKDAALDPAVSKTGTTSERKPEGKPKKEVNMVETLGLDGVTRVVGRWGFQGKALLTDVRVEAPMPRRGLVGMLDQTSFRKDRMPPIPRGAGAFLIGSCDPVKAFDAVIDAMVEVNLKSGDKTYEDDFPRMLEAVVMYATGQRLREDLLGHLGSAWCLYSDPQCKKGEANMPALLVQVDDAREFGKVLDSLAKRVNVQFRTLQKGDADELPSFALEALPAPERGYRLTSPAGIIAWLGKGQEPTITVGDSYMAIAANPALARAAIAAAARPAAERWGPSGALAEAFECLPAELTSLTVGDPRDSAWPELVEYLPKLVQYVASAYEVVEGDLPESSMASKFLGLMGVPQAGGFRLRIDPAKVPTADALRAEIFPSVLATAVDDGGIRFIGREAIPFACAGPSFHYSSNSSSGETLAVELRPFLFPCFNLQIKHNAKKKAGGTFTFGMHGKFAPNNESKD